MTEICFIINTVLFVLFGFIMYLVISAYDRRLDVLERLTLDDKRDYKTLDGGRDYKDRHISQRAPKQDETENEQTLIPSRVPAEFLVTKMVVPLKDRIVIGVWDDYVGYCHKNTLTAEEAKKGGWFVRNSANSKWVRAVDPPNYTIDLPPPLDTELKP